ncbi:thioredoxin domain-containing protein [Oculatella sp. LEGE 06141]|uniref:thioredoxin domain-containing protein n=1 Tax=Oculatella sp. LEGE 06141 TaxID=1828648 RepID=UPI00187F00E8|nr:thioredoxin domain-containing protein [Oculatella sp. LEGE 06141]MBE9182963.1 thioredoxin domain-containing protein [Oculatella sp. LEGE 06141]
MNRLAQSQSLYLRKHAANPIDWWTWCDAALEKAKQENLPIFLSIGYSSCHWCTVMEGEAFSDEAIAAYMNAHFLPIKVDREERPDLDSIYMQTLQVMTGSKGWPLNLFLSPDDRIPFYAGTYFPLEPKYGRPGFLDVLHQIRHVYDTDADKVSSIKGDIVSRLQQTIIPTTDELSADLLQRGLIHNAELLISKGTGPSFPMIPYATAALRAARFDSPRTAYGVAGICEQRGLDLFLGGIFDHIGGGFHRYTVDPTWTVSHFEKMLYDNGQILEYLADLWSTGTKDVALERAIAQTVNWLKREMTAPQGYFYAAQDADSFITPDAVAPEEGAFYVWSYAELAQHLTVDELQALTEHCTVTPSGNFEGKNVLQRYQSGACDQLEAAFTKLFTIRYGSAPDAIAPVSPARTSQEAKTHPWTGRIPPVTDTKLIVAWNSLMISGLARAAVVFQNREYLDIAAIAAQFILDHQWIDERLHRINYGEQPNIIAQSEDYALLIKALIDLEQATLSISPSSPSPQSWLSQAVGVQQEFDEFLWSTDSGGYYNTDASDHLVMRERSYDDGSLPSANGVAIANLVRLFLLTKEMPYLDRAEQALRAFSSVMINTPHRCPSLFTALDWFRNQTLVQTSGEAIASLSLRYLPTIVLHSHSDRSNNVVGLVCQGLSCQSPACSWEQLQEQVCQSMMRG